MIVHSLAEFRDGRGREKGALMEMQDKENILPRKAFCMQKGWYLVM